VKLARWEERGYYALRASADKAQRALHKLQRRAAAALAQPAAAVLAGAAAAGRARRRPGRSRAEAAQAAARCGGRCGRRAGLGYPGVDPGGFMCDVKPAAACPWPQRFCLT